MSNYIRMIKEYKYIRESNNNVKCIENGVNEHSVSIKKLKVKLNRV